MRLSVSPQAVTGQSSNPVLFYSKPLSQHFCSKFFWVLRKELCSFVPGLIGFSCLLLFFFSVSPCLMPEVAISLVSGDFGKNDLRFPSCPETVLTQHCLKAKT